MSSAVACAFRIDELDGEMLTRPFGVLTNWRVIAGAPSCGKSTLTGLLAEAGFQTVPEPARAYMEGELAHGRSIDDIHHDAADLQRTLANLQATTEARLMPGKMQFLDGALPSSLAWYRAFGLDPNEILPMCRRHRYARVYLLDPLPLDVDEIRFDNTELVRFIDHWIARDFHSLGYDVVRVPVLPPEQRLAFVLDRTPIGAPA
jgi:predicted ATPase